MLSEKMLTPQQEAELCYIGAVIPPLPSKLIKPPRKSFSAKEALSILLNELEIRLKKEKKPIAFKMSGGLDSRILAFLLREVWDNYPLEIHLVCHPALKLDEDVDVVLAKKTLNYLGFKGNIQIQKGYPSTYLKPLNKGSIQLTGIYGTEILGGIMFEVLPVIQNLQRSGVDNYLKSIPPLHRKHIEKIIRTYLLNEDTWFFCQVFLNSPLSTIYDSSTGSWKHPSLFKEFCIAPFSFPRLTERIMQLKKSELAGYEFYHKIFQLLPDKYKQIPLCSDYTRYKAHPHPYPLSLKNAKQMDVPKL